ncbi:MAG: CRISPR-associated endonuclease Cas1 [Lentisphaerae bacterium RIFOXYB12_FULL_65_16]|nr:MAG: CRISPR-associated endonuclease Cas1 [Lentisphaerae bacterium RIFOXYA12_64_32]OGV88668.1 MAG: CRISPR-associated endonuclease Cas1 [Lentisphaerae bacterium RIFOXYB12_FULL_65_16]
MPTLYLNGYETEAKLNSERIEVSRLDHEKDDVVTMQVPFFDLDRVVIVGRANVSTAVLQRLAREGIPAHFMGSSGRWLGTLSPMTNGHALRRLRQYELARNAPFALDVARALVTAKIRNSRRVLQRLSANRDDAQAPAQLDVGNSLQELSLRATQAKDLDSLRGLEGLAGALYFNRFGTFFPEDMPFKGRSRRPPRDPANALLSWTYTIVLTEVDSAVRAAGLDPCLGFLHEISYGRPSMALDLLEPLRAPLCDLLAIKMLSHKQLKPEDFEYRAEDGGTYLTREARKQFFCEYERSMTRRFAEEKNGPHTDFRGVLRAQVNTLLRAMDGQGLNEFFIMP